MTERNNLDLLTMTAEIVVAAVGPRNMASAMDAADVAAMISEVYRALETCGQPVPQPEPEFAPAVNPRNSVKPDYITSLIDGKRYKMLKRHLAVHGLTPDEYRVRYNLGADYPMVAPNHAEKRRRIALENGLGKAENPKRGRKRKAA